MNKVVNELDKRDIVWTYGLTGPAKRLIDTQLVIHSEDPRAGDTVPDKFDWLWLQKELHESYPVDFDVGKMITAVSA